MQQTWKNLMVFAGSVALIQGIIGCGSYGSSDVSGSPTALVTANKTVLALGEAIELDATGSTADTLNWSSNGSPISACDGQLLCIVVMDTAGTFELGVTSAIQQKTAFASVIAEVQDTRSPSKSAIASSSAPKSPGGSGSGGGASSFSPSDISGLSLWMDGQDTTTFYSDTNCTSEASSGTVACWKDKSGNNRNLSGATGPSISSSAINSKPALHFTRASGQSLSRSSNLALTANDDTYTVVGVWQSNRKDVTQIVWEQNGTASTTGDRASLMLTLNGNYGFNGYNNDAYDLVPYTTSSPKTSIMTVNNGTVTVYDKGVPFTGSINAGIGHVGTTTMWVGLGNVAGEYMDGDIGEVMVFDHPLTTTERQSLETYLEAKWAITPAFSPSDISGLSLWMDSQDTDTLFSDQSCSTGTTSGTVACWKDKSGNNRNLSGASGPTLNTINSKMALNFNGSNQSLTNTDMTKMALATGDDDYTIVAVWQTAVTNASQVVWEQCAPSGTCNNGMRSALLLSNAASYGYNGYNNDAHNIMPYSANSPRTTIMTVNNGAVKVYDRGIPLTGTISATTGNVQPGFMGVGQRFDGTEYLNGKIGEVMIFDHPLTDTEVVNLEAYLENKWSISNYIASMANLKMWLDANDSTTLFGDSNCTTTTLTANAVACWKDKSTNGYNLTQTTGSAQPLLTSGGMNSKPVLRFDGTNDTLTRTASTPIGSGDDTYTVIAAWKTTINNTSQVIWEQNSTPTQTNGYRGALIILGGSNYGYNGENNDAHNISTYATSTAYGSIMTANSATVTIYSNGTTGSGTINATTENISTQIVTVGSKRGTGEYLNGDLAEVIVLDRVITAAEITQIKAYLNNKWGMTQ